MTRLRAYEVAFVTILVDHAFYVAVPFHDLTVWTEALIELSMATVIALACVSILTCNSLLGGIVILHAILRVVALVVELLYDHPLFVTLALSL